MRSMLAAYRLGRTDPSSSMGLAAWNTLQQIADSTNALNDRMSALENRLSHLPSSTGLAHDEHTSVLEDRVNALENDVHFTQMGAIEAIIRRMNRLARQQQVARTNNFARQQRLAAEVTNPTLHGILACTLQTRKL